MIKVYKVKTLLKILIIILLIIIISLMAINKINIGHAITTNASNINTYKILVDVEASKLFLFENNQLIKTYKCSGGKLSTPSPIGTWTIISKAKWGEGFRTEVGWG